MKTNATKLPGILAEIEEAAGRKAALAIATAFGGTRAKFPVPDLLERNGSRYADNWLVKTVGLSTALAIVKETFPVGGQAEIPCARTVLRAEFVRDNVGSLSVADMALALSMTERGVRAIKARLRAEDTIS